MNDLIIGLYFSSNSLVSKQKVRLTLSQEEERKGNIHFDAVQLVEYEWIL